MRLFSLLILSLFLTRPAMADEADAGTRLKLVPSGRLFPLTIADPREIRTALAFSGDSQIQAWVGSYLSLLSVTPQDLYWNFHFGMEGRGYFTMRQEGGRFPLETVDGTLGLYMEYACGPWQAQLRWTHVSAHLADGSTGVPFAYSRETLSLRGGYSPGEHLQVYFGIHKLTNTMPKVHGLALQAGASYFLPVEGQIGPFVAGDLRWQEESPVNPSFAMQLGVAVHEPGSFRRSLRMYYSYFTGSDVRGQFFQSPRTIHSLTLEIPL